MSEYRTLKILQLSNWMLLAIVALLSLPFWIASNTVPIQDILPQSMLPYFNVAYFGLLISVIIIAVFMLREVRREKKVVPNN